MVLKTSAEDLGFSFPSCWDNGESGGKGSRPVWLERFPAWAQTLKRVGI